MLGDAPPKILVVDDEQEVVNSIKVILENANYQVISTTSGREALELAKIHIPDLIILDIVMPEMDGSDVASALEEYPSTAHIPIVFLTGLITKDEEQRLRGEAGKNHILAKPLTSEELIGKIEEVLGS